MFLRDSKPNQNLCREVQVDWVMSRIVNEFRVLQDVIDDLVASNLVQMPRPGVLQIQTLHASCVRSSELVSGNKSNQQINPINKILGKNAAKTLSALILLIYGGNSAR